VPLLERQRRRPTPAAAALAAVVLVLIGVFAALVADVVHVRRPIDDRLERSFATAAPGAGGVRTVDRSTGCTKTTVGKYDCHVVVRPRRRGGPAETILYRVLRTENGCWTGLPAYPPDAISRFRPLGGCERQAGG
jgi:hypothetical protein